MYPQIIKPFFDKLVALLMLIVFFPVFIVVGVALYFRQSGAVFFKQMRVGKNERIFSILKFKTMSDARDAAGNLLPDELRLTQIGAVVRKTSLDELPQLINILKGEMSFVGPRPLLVEYLPLYNSQQKRRHEVTPGVSGWAQINGRNALTWEKRFAYDVWYVENQTFLLDLKILCRTVVKVVTAEGISGDGVATMTKFTGNQP